MKESLPVVGSKVRYPRTGTAGTIEEINVICDRAFGKIDTNGLWYRLDQLICIESLRTHAPKKKQDINDFRAEIKPSSEDISEAFANVDGVGAG
jgi:hypothetical protein